MRKQLQGVINRASINHRLTKTVPSIVPPQTGTVQNLYYGVCPLGGAAAQLAKKNEPLQNWFYKHFIRNTTLERKGGMVMHSLLVKFDFVLI